VSWKWKVGLLAPLWVGLVLALSCTSPRAASWTEDFTDGSSDWLAESDASAEVEIRDGLVSILIKAPNRLAWISRADDLAGFQMAVEATEVAGPDDNEYGVLVRMQDASHFYRFSISGDGYYLISKYEDGAWSQLTGDWAPSKAIHVGRVTNLIQVDCQGSVLRFSVNGELLAEVQDDSYPLGGIGLYAGSFFEPGVEVHFDNVVVIAR